MGRCVWMVVLMGVTLLAADAAGIYRLFDDFEDEIEGSLSGQDGWYSASGDNRIIVDSEDPFNQVLYVPSQSSIVRKSLLTENTGVPNGTVRMLFMRIRISQKQTFSVGLSGLTSPYEFSDFGPEIGMANSSHNLDLRVWDNDGGNYEIVSQLAPDRWYNMWVLVNAIDNVYEIWLNDAAGQDAAEVDKLQAQDGDETFAFRTGQSRDLFTFFIKTAGGGSGTNFGPVYFDDIYLELSNTLNLTNPINLDEPIPGDADFNGCVDLFDFSVLAMSWFLPPDSGTLWQDGNFDYNDAVDMADLILMAENWLKDCGN